MELLCLPVVVLAAEPNQKVAVGAFGLRTLSRPGRNRSERRVPACRRPQAPPAAHTLDAVTCAGATASHRIQRVGRWGARVGVLVLVVCGRGVGGRTWTRAPVRTIVTATVGRMHATQMPAMIVRLTGRLGREFKAVVQHRLAPTALPVDPWVRLFLGSGFRLGDRWNRLGEAAKTRKKRGKTGGKWAIYGLRSVYKEGTGGITTWIKIGGSPDRSPKSGEAATGSASPRYSDDQ